MLTAFLFSVDLIIPDGRPSLGFDVPNPPLCHHDQTKPSSKQDVTSSRVALTSKTQDELELRRLRQKKAWDLALAPAKQVPMQAFMMWMSGSGVQIFSVMMVYMLIKGAITASISVNQTFQPFESTVVPSTASPSSTKPKSLVPQKLTFIACQSLLLLLGLWKVDGMGLLPTRMSDWIMHERRPSWALRQPMDSFTVFVP